MCFIFVLVLVFKVLCVVLVYKCFIFIRFLYDFLLLYFRCYKLFMNEV